jgi:hypothetical protein
MTTTNPIPKAFYAAWCELTTPEAKAWYKAKALQAKAIATVASTIASKAFATVQHWLKSESGSAIVRPNSQTEDLHEQTTEPAEVDAIVVSEPEAVESMAETSEANEGIDANISEPLDLDDDPTELRPAAEELAEDSLEDSEAEVTDDEVERYSAMVDELDSTEERSHETVYS